MKSFEALRKDLQVIACKLKTTLFPEGATYGHVVLICEEDEYGSYIGNQNYAYSKPVPPEDYGVAIIDIMTEVPPPLSNRTIEALRNPSLKQSIPRNEKLKHPVVDYDMCQHYKMLSHIKTHIPLTTEERAKLKAGIYLKWDGEVILRSFINDMTTGMKDASLWKVQIQPQDAGDHLVEQMYEIDPFETKVMAEWETRPTGNSPANGVSSAFCAKQTSSRSTRRPLPNKPSISVQPMYKKKQSRQRNRRSKSTWF
jgi:hypothetical protein